MADFLEATDDILGREFLTWLWYQSERGGEMFFSSGKAFRVNIEQKVIVVGGDAAQNREEIVCSGEASQFIEARHGLKIGKKVSRALLCFSVGELSYQATVCADENLVLRGVRLPPVCKDPEGDPDALFLERMYMFEQLIEMFQVAFYMFFELRIDKNKWDRATKEIGRWIDESS